MIKSDKVIQDTIDALLHGIRLNRSNPAARPLVRDSIRTVRQLRGILEARGLRKTN